MVWNYQNADCSLKNKFIESFYYNFRQTFVSYIFCRCFFLSWFIFNAVSQINDPNIYRTNLLLLVDGECAYSKMFMWSTLCQTPCRCTLWTFMRHFFTYNAQVCVCQKVKGKANTYSTTERRIPQLFLVLGSQPALTWVINPAVGCRNP